jgi:phosphatidylserine/phosphatidylglycerophosphate/cardiolipin synthase-like enzyme
VSSEVAVPAEVTFLEQGGQRPEAIAGLLANFLAAARTSLHVAIYDCRLSDPVAEPVVRALRERAAAGIAIQIAYDAGKPAAHPSPTRGDPAPPGTETFLRHHLGDVAALRPVTGGDPHQPRLMHHKYVVRDVGTPGAAVWTGSANWTDDSWSLQENNLLRIDSAELAGHYEADFRQLWERGDIGGTGAGDGGTVGVGTTEVRITFAPAEGEGIDHAIARLVRQARRRVKVCSMMLTSTAILTSLQEVVRGDRVEYGGVFDRTQMDGAIHQWRTGPSVWKEALFEEVAQPLSGKRSTPYAPGTPHDFMHNKALVADDWVVTGSFNFSHSATMNAENCLQVCDADLAARFAAYIDSLAARFARSAPRVPE